MFSNGPSTLIRSQGFFFVDAFPKVKEPGTRWRLGRHGERGSREKAKFLAGTGPPP